ncbi:MAG: hypothetical protein V2I82_05225 [Halieaceae bacterium]|jgi:hypothetical protein|nr:hypothetical protein [Halieaceae bacterium]
MLLAACASDPVQQEVAADPVDMSGHWELDYGSSDNLQAQFRTSLRGLRQQQARSAAAERAGATVGSSGSQQALYDLAQMAELVTQTQLLEIEQDRRSIRVEREGTFTLSCDYGAGLIRAQDYGIGRERCFWDGQQLVFEIRLPDGLDIVHRMSVSRDGQALAVVSSLYSSRVSGPFSLRRIYRRFEPGRSPYRCTETLSRGRVCTTERSE